MMRSWKVLANVILVLTLTLGLSSWASAEVVGHVTKVQGRVDLLKGGKLPATPVKLQEAVEPGDVLRVKSLSRAQITFIDNTIITLSPRSRLAIKAYELYPAKKKRNAVLRIFRGLAHVVVSKLFKVQQPDFIIESNTAVTGVRGTDFGVRLQPNSTTILNFKGLVQVANIFPEVGQLSRRAAKVAYGFPPKNSPRSVLLRDMQGTTVAAGLPPTLPFTITEQDKKMFMGQLTGGLTSRKKGKNSGEGSVAGGASGAGGGQASSGAGGSQTSSGAGSVQTSYVAGTVDTGMGGGGDYITSQGGPETSLTSMVSSTSSSEPAVPNVAPVGLTSGTGSAGVTAINTVTVPQVNPPTEENTTPTGSTTSSSSPTPTPTPVTYNFTQASYGYWQTDATSPTSYNLSYQGWAERTMDGSSPQYYLQTSTGTRTAESGVTFSNINSTGTSFSTTTGTVSGVPGGTLTGTADVFTNIAGGYQIISTGVPVSIAPDGTLNILSGSRTITDSSGTRIATAYTTSNSYTPGQYFQENASFTTQDQPGPAFYTVSRSVGSGGGSRTGVLPGDFNLGLFNTEFKEQNNTFDASGSTDSQTVTLQGVVAPNGQGGYTGVLSGSPSSNPSMIVAGPLNLQSSGQLNAMFLGVDDNTGTTRTLPVFWLQTPAPLYTMPISTSGPYPGTSGQISYPFSLVNYSGWQFIPNTSGGADTQSYGWGYRTGVYSTFFTSGGTATRSGFTFSPQIFTGDAYGTGTGTITSTQGSTLIGNMTYLGTNSYGISYTLNGNVSIKPNGEMTYDYTGSYTNTNTTPNQNDGTSSGRVTFYPGQYFQQASTGTVYQDSTSATVTNDGPFQGTKFDLAVNNGAPQNYIAALFANAQQVTSGLYQNAVFSQGVTTSNGDGTATGAMTSYGIDTSGESAGHITRMTGPVWVYPDGTTIGRSLGTDNLSNYIMGWSVQNTDPDAQLVIQTFNGDINISGSGNTGTVSLANDNGSTLFKTSSSGTTGGQSSTEEFSATLNSDSTINTDNTEPQSIYQTLVGVVHADGSPGPARAIGWVPDSNTLVYTSGMVYFNADGLLVYDFGGIWTNPDSTGTLSNGTLIDPVIALEQSASGSLRQTYGHYMHSHYMHRHYQRMAHARAAAWARHLISASTPHSSQALVADYINHAAIASIGSEVGEFASALTTASINAVLDEGVVPGDTGATASEARDIRAMTHRHRTAWMDTHRGQMAFHGQGHFHGHHRGPLGLHHRAFAHGGPGGLHHWALSHRGPMRLHHRAFTHRVPMGLHHRALAHRVPMGFHHRALAHRGPMGIHHRAMRHAPLCRRNTVPRVPHHLPAGPKLNLAQDAH
jgi:hypothetical protein